MANQDLTSPIGVISFPHLFTPQAPSEGADERYSMILIFDEAAQKTPEFKAMKQAVLDCAKAKWGERTMDMIKNKQLTLPFRDASEKSQYAGFEEGKVFISAWTKQKPDVLDGHLNDVMPSDLFPGCTGRITYNPFAYDNRKKGVSIGLNHVQIASFDGERLDGRKAGKASFGQLDMDTSGESQTDREDELEDEIPF